MRVVGRSQDDALALVVDDNPGKNSGLLRQAGHRFFYSVEEVEPLEKVDLMALLERIFTAGPAQKPPLTEWQPVPAKLPESARD